MLGLSSFESNSRHIEQASGGLREKASYNELLVALNSLLVSPDQATDVSELILHVPNALQLQFQKLTRAALDESERNQQFYYSLYGMLQQRMPSIETRIYTVVNRGGPVYILNNSAMFELQLDSVPVQIYYEIVNGIICIKFHAQSDDIDKRREIRTLIRQASHSVLEPKYTLIDSGRTGAYMIGIRIISTLPMSLDSLNQR